MSAGRIIREIGTLRLAQVIMVAANPWKLPARLSRPPDISLQGMRSCRHFQMPVGKKRGMATRTAAEPSFL